MSVILEKPDGLFLILFLIPCFLVAACGSLPEPQDIKELETPTSQYVSVESNPTETFAVTQISQSISEYGNSQNNLDQINEHLSGLKLGEFFEESFRILTSRSPETIVAVGVTDAFPTVPPSLDDISDAYIQETYQIVSLILDRLKIYDESKLTPEDKISYDVYRWYLSDILAGQEFMYHDYPATYYPITAIHEDLIRFFSEIQTIRNIQDAQDYLIRLALVDKKIYQLIDGLKKREAVGIIPPRFAIEWAIYGDLGTLVKSQAVNTPFYTGLQEKLLLLSSGTPKEMDELLNQAEKIIQDEVLPAYQDLFVYLSNMETYPGEDSGVWRLPHGQEYYAYTLRHFTTTDLSADDIHQLGLNELDRIHQEMRLALDQLGYSNDISIVEAYNKIAQESPHINGEDVLPTYEELISTAKENINTVFDILPKADIIVLPDEFGDFYIHPTVDGSRPGVFYAGVGISGKEYYAMPTLAYHETIPGHHLQIAIAQELRDLPSFRRAVSFTSFTEGWALYAENLAYELGWYEGDPYGTLGFLQSQAFRAARLVVDTGLHAYGWTFNQAQEFFTENTGFEMNDNVNPRYQIARYIVWPGQSTSYTIGYLKIMDLRQMVMDKLGSEFDLKGFHRIVLANGSLPLEVLEQIVDFYISDHLNKD